MKKVKAKMLAVQALQRTALVGSYGLILASGALIAGWVSLQVLIWYMQAQ